MNSVEVLVLGLGLGLVASFFYLGWLLWVKPLVLDRVKAVFLGCGGVVSSEDFDELYFECSGSVLRLRKKVFEIEEMVSERVLADAGSKGFKLGTKPGKSCKVKPGAVIQGISKIKDESGRVLIWLRKVLKKK